MTDEEFEIIYDEAKIYYRKLIVELYEGKKISKDKIRELVMVRRKSMRDEKINKIIK
jgi:hypothetical protein